MRRDVISKLATKEPGAGCGVWSVAEPKTILLRLIGSTDALDGT